MQNIVAGLLMILGGALTLAAALAFLFIVASVATSLF